MLKIRSSDLYTSAVKPDQYPPELWPQIALIGRSNAGKSSLINSLIYRKNLARTSSAPGKTRLLNFYDIVALDEEKAEHPFFFVDLPGYGYAKVAKTERELWLSRLETYLSRNQERLLCWQLVDIRHPVSPLDIAMHNALKEGGFQLRVIANKSDKISKNQKFKNLAAIARDLQLKPEQITAFSAVNHEGREQLQEILLNYIKA